MRTMRYDLETIRERTDLRLLYPNSLIRERNQNKEWLQAVCIFHDDQSPSMRVGKEGFRCMASSCGVHGDIFYFVQLSEAVDFPAAVRILSDGANLKPYVPPPKARIQVVRPPDFSWDEIHRFTKTMTDSDYEYLAKDRMIPRWTAESLNIGSLPLVDMQESSGLFTIPIITDCPDTIKDVKIYNPRKQFAKGKYFHLRSGVHAELAFLANIPEGEDEVYIMAGEHDYAVAFSKALPAITATGGEGMWRREWTTQLERFKHIWIVYDNDEAGWKGANEIIKQIPSAHRINLGLLGDARVKDFAEMVARGYSLDDFYRIQKESLRRYG